MLPRFVGRLGLADAVTTANAALGFLAVVVAFSDVELAARLVLLGAIADGLDGVVARYVGGSNVGPYLDSLADVATFCVAPAVLVYAAVDASWPVSFDPLTAQTVATAVVPALFVSMGVVRLGMYTAYDAGDEFTEGAPTTLAATIISATVLCGVHEPTVLLAGTAAFVYLMVSRIRYPDLLARDALLMGVVNALAVLVPYQFGRTFPWAILTLGIAYLVAGPLFYWRGGWVLTKLYGNA